MPIDADSMAERRRLTRKLSLWRVLAVVAGCAALVGLAVGLIGRTGLTGSGQHVARVVVSGLITGDRPMLQLLERIGNQSTTSAVLVIVNSPGGTVPGSEALHESMRNLSAKKPVVAVVNNLAASGGYIAAMGADRIVARQTALVGSIGVIFQAPNVSQLLDRIGVKVETERSTPLKASPSGVEPTSPEAREAVRDLVRESYDWFRGMVKTRRTLSDPELQAVADGRVFSGRQALGLKLVDEIGSEKEAVAWLEREKGVAKGLTVREYRRRSGFEDFGFGGALAGLAEAVGLGGLARGVERAAAQAEAMALDGLLAVWQPVVEK
jgi:protease IV